MPYTLHKPAGVPVFAPHGDPGGDCVLARLLGLQPWRRELPWPDGFGGGIAHRLDVGTSGALLVADDLVELEQIRALFGAGALSKTYLLHAARDVPWDVHACDRAIAHDKRHRKRMVVQRGATTPHRGKWWPSRTELRRRGGRVWEVVIRTGVTHQIRVHAAFLGLPITGDALYGGGVTDEPGHRLHHVGLVGPGIATDPVPPPPWLTAADASTDRG